MLVEQQQDNSQFLFAMVGAVVFLAIIFLLFRSQTGVGVAPYVNVPRTPVITPHQYINPAPLFDYQLDSPGPSADLEAILTYLIHLGRYADTNEPYSDLVITALKTASRWNLSSTSPPIWYFRSWDNLHNFQLIYSSLFNAWVIKPAL